MEKMDQMTLYQVHILQSVDVNKNLFINILQNLCR